MNKKNNKKSQSKKRAKSSSRVGSFGIQRFGSGRIGMVVFILVFAAVGTGFLLSSKADSPTSLSQDEIVQYQDINTARTQSGLKALPNAVCLNQAAQAHARLHVATDDTEANVAKACPYAYDQFGSNFSELNGGCPASSEATDTCSQTAFIDLMTEAGNSSSCHWGHYDNILSVASCGSADSATPPGPPGSQLPLWNYVGVGVDRDSSGEIWVVQDFLSTTEALPVSQNSVPAPTPATPTPTPVAHKTTVARPKPKPKATHATKGLKLVSTGTNTLKAGKALAINHFLRSPNYTYVLLMQANGNLVLDNVREPSTRPGLPNAIWDTHTVNQNTHYFALQKSGNLVVLSKGGKVTWQSGTSGKNNRLVLQNDGNLVLFNAANAVIWTSGTAGK